MADFLNHEKNEEKRPSDRGCPTHAYQHVAVSVPVAVIPYAKVDRVRIRCNGNAVVSAGETYCRGKKDGICCFTVSQSFCVEIPVTFGASVNLGDTFVDCLGAVNTNMDNFEDEEDLE